MISHRLRVAMLGIAAGALAACGGGSDPSSSGAADGGVTSADRLGWSQVAASPTELDTFGYAVYVDGVRAELDDVTCATTPGDAGYACSARMPAMGVGTHMLEISAFVDDGDDVESPRSLGISVTVSRIISAVPGEVYAPSAEAHADTPAPGSEPTHADVRTADGLALRVDTAVAGLDQPTSLAVGPDGLLLVGTASGAIYSTETSDDDAVPELAYEPSGERGAILDIRFASDYAETRFVYVLDVTSGADPQFRVSRLRAAGDDLGERAVLFTGGAATSAHPSGALDIAADGRLLVALDDGGDPARAASAASLNGKVLRLNADGTTPADQPSGSPVYASDLTSPRALQSDPATGALWIADPGRSSAMRLQRTSRGMATTPFRMRTPGWPSAVAVYRGDLIAPMRGDLLAVADDSRDLLRVKLAGASQSAVAGSEQLAIDGESGFRSVKVGPDGAIYLLTTGSVLRLAPR